MRSAVMNLKQPDGTHVDQIKVETKQVDILTPKSWGFAFLESQKGGVAKCRWLPTSATHPRKKLCCFSGASIQTRASKLVRPGLHKLFRWTTKSNPARLHAGQLSPQNFKLRKKKSTLAKKVGISP